MEQTKKGNRYTGKVCEKHPELNGLRYSGNGGCVECNRAKARKRGKELKPVQRRHAKTKAEILMAYGPVCSLCGVINPYALTVDHVDHGGAVDRKNKNISGTSEFYRVVKKEGFPSKYRILCFNCNVLEHVRMSIIEGKHNGFLAEELHKLALASSNTA